ncbi:hypothetical protein OC842_005274 [Tilletia horrida]|uniref:Uncharacterized protein n=1 Tax=Tilletia horrida TaxID=155126 RepID=A0AAN6JIK3_9BASI|nr:hypothetical protein OC842_005274 [Tilletia horrida]
MARLSIRHAVFFFAFALLTVLFLHLRVVLESRRLSLGTNTSNTPGGAADSNLKANPTVLDEELATQSAMSKKPASQLNLASVIGARTSLFSFRSATQSRSADPVDLPFYEDAALGTSSIKRVLIQIHGQGRDADVNWREAAEARAEAASKSGGQLSVKDVLVIAPLFFNGNDKERFGWQGKGSTGQLLVWKGNGWGEGEPNQYPHREKTVSSFEALDAMLRYYSDRARFPNVESIVVSGHSLGGQMVHRYAILSDLPLSSPVKLSFIVANPSTFLYLDGDRPRPGSNDDDDDAKHVEGYNHYKYGLEGIDDSLGEYFRLLGTAQQGGKALWRRFTQEREVHYIEGDRDHGVGDERPQAYAQGKDRIDRLKNYIAWASSPERGGHWPEGHTVEWAPGVAHDAGGILKSEAGLRRAFLD